MNPPVVVQRFQDELQRMTDERHAPIFRDAEQVKHWREEDARQGNPWGQE